MFNTLSLELFFFSFPWISFTFVILFLYLSHKHVERCCSVWENKMKVPLPMWVLVPRQLSDWPAVAGRWGGVVASPAATVYERLHDSKPSGETLKSGRRDLTARYEQEARQARLSVRTRTSTTTSGAADPVGLRTVCSSGRSEREVWKHAVGVPAPVQRAVRPQQPAG